MNGRRLAEKSSRNCPLCGHPGTPTLSLKHAVVWECTAVDCTLQFADPQLSEQELERAYTDFYYPTEEGAQEARYGNTPDDTFRQVFRKMRARLGDLTGLRLLDYGCGRGALLRVSLEFGLRPSGIESDPLASTIAAKLSGGEIHKSLDELQAVDPDRRFDLIILWTVIEHLRNPWDELARLRTFLRPGGWLLISTMDIRCLRARLEGDKWENYENPTHLYYFDRKSLRRAICAAGFSEFSEWRLKIRYAHHGTLRRWLYHVSFLLGLADGIYYLCHRTIQASEQNDSPSGDAISSPPKRQLKDNGNLVNHIASQMESG
jgi:SAM-dependent methyltransferase